MSAPERIWVDVEYLTNPKRSLAFRNHVTHVQKHILPGEVEYRRADLPPARSAALAVPEVAAIVEALRHEVKRSRRHLAQSTLDALAALDAAKP